MKINNNELLNIINKKNEQIEILSDIINKNKEITNNTNNDDLLRIINEKNSEIINLNNKINSLDKV